MSDGGFPTEMARLIKIATSYVPRHGFKSSFLFFEYSHDLALYASVLLSY
jgi:hypothetical protein